ncbi:GntR family transcriptional regulator [Tuanshanicoccus lijuaniae]|uniref:substrate-binding domain-containing protein n=1 Tax=Aerococcaceae bacterium zg-1292 TaxID=2774330 RepID=UPI00193834F1|nr:GntR family transcriptional regulator [Aerococcaceae bacterium zg-1292]QQA36845.1 GntR family transcriptional regulator [Aerococcaceae bacterium zg-1292]
MIVKYRYIADDIQKKILQNEFKVGSMIPPESKLQEMYQVSRHTIRQAIGLLVEKGYLRAEKGVGTFVLKPQLNGPKDTKTIGVITTYLSDYIFPQIIEGIEETLRANGYSLLLGATKNDPIQEELCISSMLKQGVEGLLIEPTSSNLFNQNIAYYSKIKEKNIPVLFINAYYDLLDIPYISIDDVHAGEMTTNYLIDNNHVNIALVTKMDDIQGKLRLKGYIKAHEKNNLSFTMDNIVQFDTNNQKDVIQLFVKQLACRNNRPTAVVCYNDDVASYLIQQLEKNNLNVPTDISLISHDNSFLAKIYQLNSVIHPQKDLGIEAAKKIIETLEKNKVLETKLYPPKLKIRKSVLKHTDN